MSPGAAERRAAALQGTGLLLLGICLAAAAAQPDFSWAVDFAAAAAAAGTAEAASAGAQQAQQDESFSAGLLRFLLEDTRSLGGAAPACYAAAVAGLEVLPLFVPQPAGSLTGFFLGATRVRLWMSLLAGLLFGPFQGAALNLAGSTGAAAIAFAKARTAQGPSGLLAAIEAEDTSGTVRKVYSRVKGVISSGSLWQQAFVVALLRLTPFAPFRAVSYYLGQTPIRFASFAGGTAAGRGFWSLLYAAIGSYSRGAAARGVGLDGVLQELADTAGYYSREALIAGALLAAGAAGGWLVGVVGPEAPGLPEEGRLLERVRERRELASDGAISFARRLVPSEEWLDARFWVNAVREAVAAGRRALGALADDGEGDLDAWLRHQSHSTPLRRQAADALRAIRDGAQQLGVESRPLKQQVRRISNSLEETEEESTEAVGNDGSGGGGRSGDPLPVKAAQADAGGSVSGGGSNGDGGSKSAGSRSDGASGGNSSAADHCGGGSGSHPGGKAKQ